MAFVAPWDFDSQDRIQDRIECERCDTTFATAGLPHDIMVSCPRCLTLAEDRGDGVVRCYRDGEQELWPLELRKISLAPGDVVVATVGDDWDNLDYEAVARELNCAFPDNEVVVVPNGMRLEVVSQLEPDVIR